MHRTRLLGLLFCVPACSTVADGPVDYDDEAGMPAYGVEATLAEPNGITFTALDFGKHYTRLAVGNVARGVSEPGCCFDYVIGGPTADDVRVVFGGGSNDGLTFLDDRPDEVLAVVVAVAAGECTEYDR